ncbi:MAG TPA: hypothetical protein VK901_14625 [Nitrospiraceae bacterium]|nr:hypothetical protein [Nitrospiraceae bacterium]
MLISNVANWLFGCAHKKTTFPVTARSKGPDPSGRDGAEFDTYVVCLDCGRHIPYNWTNIGVEVRRPFSGGTRRGLK